MSPEKRKTRSSTKKDTVVVEEAKTEDLPPGWTKDVRIRKNSSRIKKDPYYKDPVTGYKFRSLKEVQRYLKSGEVGRKIVRPKDMETRDASTHMHTAAADGLERKEGKEISGVDVLETKNEPEEQTDLSTPSNEKSRLPENLSEVPQKQSKSSKKTTSTLPRRASKRLAGVDVDPETCRQTTTKVDTPCDLPPLFPSPPEPKQRRQTTTKCGKTSKGLTPSDLAAPKERDERGSVPETSSKKDPKLEKSIDNMVNDTQHISTTVESGANVKKTDLSADESRKSATSAPQEHKTEANIENPAKETQASPTFLPQTSCTTPKNLDPILLPENNLKPKQVDTESPVNFSVNDLWTDPCIEFAVKTLTGDIPIPTEGQMKPDNMGTTRPEFPLGEMWTDPCIEFAVKTLTGAIPVGDDICVQDYLQHQMGTNS